MISNKLFLLEQEIASFLLNALEMDQITLERASEISKYILHALPDNITDEQIDKILPFLNDQFEAERLIHEGKIQEATKLMNNYIQQKI